MVVLQFAFDGGRANPHRLENHREHAVVYTGTHDNDTALGWWPALPPRTRRRPASTRREPRWSLIELALASRARLAIVPAQDVLGLGSEARMNTPGRPEGNWTWRLRRGQLTTSTRRGCARRLAQPDVAAGDAQEHPHKAPRHLPGDHEAAEHHRIEHRRAATAPGPRTSRTSARPARAAGVAAARSGRRRSAASRSRSARAAAPRGTRSSGRARGRTASRPSRVGARRRALPRSRCEGETATRQRRSPTASRPVSTGSGRARVPQFSRQSRRTDCGRAQCCGEDEPHPAATRASPRTIAARTTAVSCTRR